MRIQSGRATLRLGGTLACAILVAGCSLGNPYVVRTSDQDRANLCAIHDECSVAEGKHYAYALASRYREKLSQHARMESSVGAGGIVLGSIVLALAASDAHVDAFKAAGVLGASGYGLNTWYSNKPREEIYAKGMVALSCAVSAVHPLALPRTERAKLSLFLDRAGSRIDTLSAAAASVRDITNTGVGTPEQRAMSAALLQASREEIERASVSAEAAAKLDSLSSAAGNALVDSVDRIEVAVDDALRKTVPEGTLALQIAGSLGDLAGKVVPGLKLTAGILALASSVPTSESGLPSTPSSRSSALENATDALRSALTALRVEHARVTGVLAAFSGTGVATRLDACAALGLSMLSVTPSEIAFTQGAAASASAVIDHGKPPYSATTLGPSSKGIEVKSPLPFDRRLDLAISEETLANRYPIVVSDANGRTTQLTLIVSPAVAPAPQSVPSTVPPPKPPVAKPAAFTVTQLMNGLKSLHGSKLGGGKYEIGSFVQADRVIHLKLAGDPKISDSGEQSSIAAELDGTDISGEPLGTRLKTLGMSLELPK